jgi:hypothetical protein
MFVEKKYHLSLLYLCWYILFIPLCSVQFDIVCLVARPGLPRKDTLAMACVPLCITLF